MWLHTTDARSALRAYILENYLFTDDPSALNDADSFQEHRIVDSMGMMQLIHFIEREFHITVLDEDMVPEKLDSVDRLVAFIGAREPGPVPGPSTLVGLLHRSVERNPDGEAIVSGRERLSYRQLWAAVAAARARLIAAGVAPGDRVALLMDNSPAFAAVYYGTLSAGGVAVPLNCEARARDLAAWVTHSGARVLVADATHPELAALRALVAPDLQLLTADQDGHAAAPHSHAAAPVGNGQGAADLAVILYTSGTTGDPKGVMLSHGNLASNVMAINQYLGLRDNDRVLCTLPFFYSYGSSVLHTHLAAGGCVVLEPGMMYPQRVADRMRDERVTGFSGVPWMFKILMTRSRMPAMRSELPALRYFTQAGAPMAAEDIERVRAAFPGVDFFVMYGQTEATARLSYLPPDQLDARLGSVGLPVPGVTIQIRRPDGSRANAGERGEVVASGPNIMLGYWHAPDATRAVIVEDGVSRWLRTGDVGYIDEAGYLWLVGRNSEMIKTGAHRVSPIEIDAVVRELDGVADAAAFAVADDLLGEAIHVAVVPAARRTLQERDVLAHCRKHLSLYKMPQRIHFRDALPRTTSGKIRRHALAMPADSGSTP